MLHKLSLPVQLLITLGSVVIFGKLLPFTMVQILYTCSIIIKECLGFLLPCMIYSFITHGIVSFQKNTPIIIAILLLCVFASNMLTPLLAYLVSTNMLTYMTPDIFTHHVNTAIHHIQPLYTISLPRLLSAEYAIILAVLTGMYVSYTQNKKIESVITSLKNFIESIITRFFIPILPLYIFGFLIELHYKGVFFDLFQSYGKTYALIIGLQYFIIFILYFIASQANLHTAFSYMKIALPSYITAFGTMSSTAAIPVTVTCAEKNTNNKPLAQIATPILANIHMTGDAVTVPVLAIVTLYLFQGTIPSITTFISFIIYYSATMLGASGIPGGAVIVMIPILKSILGFTDDMISIMMTLHLLQDGFGTGGNVMGDGALMIIINKILKKLKI